jgi:hypothetical protein
LAFPCPLDVKTLTGKNIITEIDNFVNKTLRVKFPKEVKNILNEKRVSNKKIVEMQKFIEGSKEYTKSGISISTLVPFFDLMLSNLRKFVIFDIISNICLS